MPNDRLLTPPQRSAAIRRARDTLALLSGAGCGKTFVLARRFTELLTTSPHAAPLGRIVALTFTDKAAAEMAHRVRGMLGEFASEAPAKQKAKLLAWLDEINEARIMTIHGFCANLLRTYAVQAGIDPEFRVFPDELAAAVMRDQAAEQACLAAIQEHSTDTGELVLRMGFDGLLGEVVNLLNSRTAWRREEYADPAQILDRWRRLADEQRAAAWSRLDADSALRTAVQELAAVPCADTSDKLHLHRQSQLEVMRELLGLASDRTPENFARLNAKMGNIGTAKAWGDKETAQAVRQQLRSLVEGLDEYAVFARQIGAIDEEAARCLWTLATLAGKADDLYAAAKRASGLLDFDDLLLHARSLLETNPAVRAAVSSQIDQLLLDEGQDTDAFGMDLLTRAISPGPGVPTPDRLPEGRLFVVGDAKQSIYRFRGAQVEVFQNLCDQFGPDRQESLDTSFRTHAAGVAFANHLFERLMADDYRPIRAHRPFAASTDRGSPVEILLARTAADSPVESAAEATSAQASAVAGRIRRILDDRQKLVWDRTADTWRAAEPRDIAVLFARMTQSLQYERELSRAGVPYYVIAGTGFYQQQEVRDVLSALACIDNPHDDIAFFGALRSGLFGLDDNALMHIAEDRRSPYLPALANHPLSALDAQANERLRQAVELLWNLHRRKDASGIADVLEELLEATAFEAVLLGQFQGRRMLGNVRRLVDHARSADASAMTMADFVRQLGQRIIDDSRSEQAAVAGEEENVVRIMTIHKAKGLEFPVVILPDLNAADTFQSGKILRRADWGLTCSLGDRPAVSAEFDPAHSDATTDRKPLAYSFARRLEKQADAAERIRQFYVAVTRHEDHLILVGADWRDKEGRLKNSDSFLRKLDDIFELPDPAETQRQERIFEADGQRYTVRVQHVATDPGESHSASNDRALKHVVSADNSADFGEAILALASRAKARPDALPVGPLPVEVGRSSIAVTTLVQFEQCPMRYRWQHELHLSPSALPEEASCDHTSPADTSAAIDARTLGTLLHSCLEQLDFGNPQPAEAMVRQAAAAMKLPASTDLVRVIADFEAMRAGLRQSGVWDQAAAAVRCLREQDFLMDVGSLRLRGQIDMMYEDAASAWHVLDYKSDRIDAPEIPEHARQYEMQLMLYAVAVERMTGRPPADVSLYFLRPATAHRIAITPDRLASAARRVQELAGELTRARRGGSFEMRRGDHCTFCPYRRLCGTA